MNPYPLLSQTQRQRVSDGATLPPLRGSFFNLVGGEGFQRPFELATLRLRNMSEVLSHWRIYVPDARYLTQRGATVLFDAQGTLQYEHRDRGILDFAAKHYLNSKQILCEKLPISISDEE